MVLVYSSFRETQRCVCNGQEKCKGPVPIGRGLAIIPFCMCNDHFTNDCFEEDTTIAARFGIGKRRRLQPNAIPTVFHRQASTQVLQGSNDEYAEETQCTSRKRPILPPKNAFK